jgi:2',3'-cyclic-nucleotide 2'-phosphodiesterase (5'-nucleotidase family)
LGGIAKRDTVIKSLRDKSQNQVLLLHNGDIINEPGLQQELKYQTAIAAMCEMGYDALNVGDGDFWLGIEQLRTMIESSSFPFVSANVLIHNERYFEPYIIKEIDLGGMVLRVGVIGCLSTSFETVIKEIGLDLTISPPVTILSSQLRQLNQKADLIILLAHCDITEAKNLAEEFPSLNVIVSGHQLDEGLDEPVTFGKTLIVNPGIKGRKLGELKLTLDKNKNVIDYEHRLIPLPEGTPDSPTISALLSLYYKMLEDFDLLHKTEKVELSGSNGAYVGSESCKTCHEKAYAAWQASKHAHAYDTLVRVKRNFNRIQ